MTYDVTYIRNGEVQSAELWAEDDDTALAKARLCYGTTAKVFRAKF